MADETTIHHVHTYPDAVVESVKVEKNSRGFNWEIKAATIDRVLELLDRLKAELATRTEE
jgi:hypothetical protein